MLRQGDILLIPTNSELDGFDELPRIGGSIVLAEGEATGHLHAIAAPHASLYASPNRRSLGPFLRVEKEVLLTHPEHDAMPVPVGKYLVRRQHQYRGGGGVDFVGD